MSARTQGLSIRISVISAMIPLALVVGARHEQHVGDGQIVTDQKISETIPKTLPALPRLDADRRG